MARVNTDNIKCWKCMEKLEVLSSLNGNITGNIFGNPLRQYLYHTHTKTHICVHKKTCERMYTGAVFMQPKLHTIQIAVFRRMGKLGYCNNKRLHSTEN